MWLMKSQKKLRNSHFENDVNLVSKNDQKMDQYFTEKLGLFLTEVSFETSEGNQLSDFQNGYFFEKNW